MATKEEIMDKHIPSCLLFDTSSPESVMITGNDVIACMDEWANIVKDAQTIAGIELALKKCLTKTSGHAQMSIATLDPAAILSELKNDIKEG